MSDSMFSASPVVADSADGQPINTGTSFRVTGAVSCTHHRFFASTLSYAAITVTARLYELSSDTAGTLLAEKTYDSASITTGAYNSVAWDTPVTLSTGKVYRTQHYVSNGHYVATLSALGSDVTSAGGLLVAIGNGTTVAGFAVGNGKFKYGAAAALADTTSAGTCFFDDVIVDPVSSTVTGSATDAATSTSTAVARVVVRAAGSSAAAGSATGAGRVRVRASATDAATSTGTATAQGTAAGNPLVTVSTGRPLTTTSRG